MKLRFTILTMPALMVALAAPGALAKDNGKAKGKDKEKKAKVERVVKDDDRHGRRDRDDDDDGRREDGKMTICHIPPGNSAARHTITVSDSAWQAHRNHGDHRGSCGDRDDRDDNDGRGDAFRRLDRNGDGLVSRGEWPHGDDSFRRHDRNGDGVLSLDEYRRR